MPARTPRRLKLLSNTLRPSRDRVELEADPVKTTPEAPIFLDAVGAAEFERVAGFLQSLGMLSDGDLGVLTAYAATWGALVRQWRNGLMPKSAEVVAFRQLAGELGLTPRSRAQIPTSPRTAANNAFANNGKVPPAKRR